MLPNSGTHCRAAGGEHGQFDPENFRSAFGAARREGLIDDNPAERVAVLKKK
jgi:hypothetical protein